ncbi:tRNA_anti-like [Flavobacterium noncentrifugens]|uniref:tRNA_anti-like n=2 Tax=Flavobacterium noncentrifugens TaxID=1128970 RepID=A0A1G8WTB2_9FLAO|nr:tRNA_anti-like [Flavobacterium noncentrifugens]
MIIPMKKTYKIVSVAAVILAFGLFGGYAYVMKGGSRDVNTEEPAYTLNAVDLIADFNKNAEDASKKYLNKTIEVSGTISASDGIDLTLNQNIICNMQQKNALKNGVQANIKGRLLGFDDLMGEIKLDQCCIIK